MKTLVCLVSLLTASALVPSASAQLRPAPVDPAKQTSQEFLKTTRDQLLGNCWLKLGGRANFRAKDGSRLKLDIGLSAELKPLELTFMSTLDQETVKLHHDFGLRKKTAILEDGRLKIGSKYDVLGIRPEDLSMSFLYWNFQREDDRKALGVARIACRVFQLANPDSLDEYAMVWISEKYLGPVKVEWYRGSAKTPFQSLEFTEFTEVNKVWVPTIIEMANDKGELQLKFEKLDAAFSKESPAQLFEKAKK
jgi:Outer membrane lipoprotein-sorting protein